MGYSAAQIAEVQGDIQNLREGGADIVVEYPEKAISLWEEIDTMKNLSDKDKFYQFWTIAEDHDDLNTDKNLEQLVSHLMNQMDEGLINENDLWDLMATEFHLD